jgi:hypothetical protein
MVLHNTGDAEETIRRMLAETQSELVSKGKQIADLQAEWDALKKEYDAYSISLQGLLKRTGRQQIVKEDWIEPLKRLTHKAKLVELAKRNNGQIKLNKIADILYTNKLTGSKSRQNTYTMIQSLIGDMVEEKVFEWVGPGTYRLIQGQQDLTSSLSKAFAPILESQPKQSESITKVYSES